MTTERYRVIECGARSDEETIGDFDDLGAACACADAAYTSRGCAQKLQVQRLDEHGDPEQIVYITVQPPMPPVPQLRPTVSATSGPFAHRVKAGACIVCGAAGDVLAATGCPAQAEYRDDGKRLVDARTFEQAAQSLHKDRDRGRDAL